MLTRRSPLAFAFAAPGVLLLLATGCASRGPTLELGPRAPGVVVVAPLRTYPVTATTIDDVRAEMRQAGPAFDGRRFDGATHYQIRWRYVYRPGAVGCRLESVRVDLLATVTMPDWRPSDEADDATKRWWRAYHAGLLRHERGHAELALETASQIAAMLRRLNGRGCSEVGEEANRRSRELLAVLRGRQRAYDAETSHGATQIRAALAATPAW